jgi:hypothetical protein
MDHATSGTDVDHADRSDRSGPVPDAPSGQRPAMTAWLRRTFAERTGPFHWLLGLRAALAFTGPAVVAHLAGTNPVDAAVLGLGGLLAVLLLSSLGGLSPRGGLRDRTVVAAGLAATVAGVCALYGVVPVHSPAGVVAVAAGAAVAGLSQLGPRLLAPVGTGLGLALFLVAEVPSTAHDAAVLAAGVALGLVVVVLTEPLRHPRVGLPALPAPVRPPADPLAQRRHAVRLAATIGVAATVTAVVGSGSVFAGHSVWMLLGVWIAMQPNRARSHVSAAQRALGTLAGGLAVVAVSTLLVHLVWIGWVLVALAFVGFGLRNVNYSWYCIGLTPIVVLGFSGHDLEPQVLVARLVWTLAGTLLALAAWTVLWPATDRHVQVRASLAGAS